MKKNLKDVCPVCRKKITTDFKLYPIEKNDRTVCERCAKYCHYSCVERVRNDYIQFCQEYSVCLMCYPEIEIEDKINRNLENEVDEYVEQLMFRNGEKLDEE